MWFSEERSWFIDSVWAAAHDRRWHTVEWITRKVGSTSAEVNEALRFLLSYGFAESRPSDGAFRIVNATISPFETFLILRNIVFSAGTSEDRMAN